MMSLYQNVIPLALSGDFLTQFFEHGWSFFYRFTLALFDDIEEKLLSTTDYLEVIKLLKDVYNSHFENLK
jgi:hypothetical protein